MRIQKNILTYQLTIVDSTINGFSASLTKLLLTLEISLFLCPITYLKMTAMICCRINKIYHNLKCFGLLNLGYRSLDNKRCSAGKMNEHTASNKVYIAGTLLSFQKYCPFFTISLGKCFRYALHFPQMVRCVVTISETWSVEWR